MYMHNFCICTSSKTPKDLKEMSLYNPKVTPIKEPPKKVIESNLLHLAFYCNCYISASAFA